MTANAAVPVISASPVHQQGMSPTPMVEGETRGPNYEQLPAEPLREEQGAGVQQRESPLPNGVSSVNLYGSGGASPAVGHGTSNVAVVADHPPRQLPVDGTEASLPTLPVERTGLRMSVLETTGSVRDDTPAASSTFSNVSSGYRPLRRLQGPGLQGWATTFRELWRYGLRWGTTKLCSKANGE